MKASAVFLVTVAVTAAWGVQLPTPPAAFYYKQALGTMTRELMVSAKTYHDFTPLRQQDNSLAMGHIMYLLGMKAAYIVNSPNVSESSACTAVPPLAVWPATLWGGATVDWNRTNAVTCPGTTVQCDKFDGMLDALTPISVYYLTGTSRPVGIVMGGAPMAVTEYQEFPSGEVPPAMLSRFFIPRHCFSALPTPPPAFFVNLSISLPANRRAEALVSLSLAVVKDGQRSATLDPLGNSHVVLDDVAPGYAFTFPMNNFSKCSLDTYLDYASPQVFGQPYAEWSAVATGVNCPSVVGTGKLCNTYQANISFLGNVALCVAHYLNDTLLPAALEVRGPQLAVHPVVAWMPASPIAIGAPDSCINLLPTNNTNNTTNNTTTSSSSSRGLPFVPPPALPCAYHVKYVERVGIPGVMMATLIEEQWYDGNNLGRRNSYFSGVGTSVPGFNYSRVFRDDVSKVFLLNNSCQETNGNMSSSMPHVVPTRNWVMGVGMYAGENCTVFTFSTTGETRNLYYRMGTEILLGGTGTMVQGGTALTIEVTAPIWNLHAPSDSSVFTVPAQCGSVPAPPTPSPEFVAFCYPGYHVSSVSSSSSSSRPGVELPRLPCSYHVKYVQTVSMGIASIQQGEEQWSDAGFLGRWEMFSSPVLIPAANVSIPGMNMTMLFRGDLSMGYTHNGTLCEASNVTENITMSDFRIFSMLGGDFAWNKSEATFKNQLCDAYSGTSNSGSRVLYFKKDTALFLGGSGTVDVDGFSAEVVITVPVWELRSPVDKAAFAVPEMCGSAAPAPEASAAFAAACYVSSSESGSSQQPVTPPSMPCSYHIKTKVDVNATIAVMTTTEEQWSDGGNLFRADRFMSGVEGLIPGYNYSLYYRTDLNATFNVSASKDRCTKVPLATMSNPLDFTMFTWTKTTGVSFGGKTCDFYEGTGIYDTKNKMRLYYTAQGNLVGGSGIMYQGGYAGLLTITAPIWDARVPINRADFVLPASCNDATVPPASSTQFATSCYVSQHSSSTKHQSSSKVVVNSAGVQGLSTVVLLAVALLALL